MKTFIALTLTAALAAPLASAQEAEEGPTLMEQGAQLFLRGLMTEMEPAINDLRMMAEEFGPAMQQFVDEMGPTLSMMLQRVDDFKHYEQPEFLPNGDIIIRRKPDAPIYVPPKGDEIDL